MKPVGIARYVLHGTSEEREELIARNRRLVALRWVYATIIAGTAIVAALLVHKSLDVIWSYAASATFIYGVNLALLFASRYDNGPLRYYQVLSILQIVTDLALATLGVIVQGGIEARTPILYVIPLINTVMLIGSGVFVKSVAFLCSVGYIATVLGVAFARGTGYVNDTMFVPFIFYPMLFFLIAQMLDYFNSRNIGQARNSAYDELLALLSHQMRHPASTISAIVDTVAFDKNLKYDKATARYFEILKKENDRQIHLINNLLEVVSPDKEQEKLQKSDIVRVILDAINSLGIAHKRSEDIKLTGDIGETILTSGNTERLRMVIDNLLDNAFRYSKPGKKIEVNVMLTSKQVIITISDHGVGILPEHQRQIFKKFGSTAAFDGEIHGAGLGMYVSEKIVHAYGGELKIKSSRGGTQATIKLQRVDND